MSRLRQVGTIGGGLALGSAFMFARTLILAMLIPAADYGRAAILAVMMAGVELLIVTGTQVRIFQHPQGDSPKTMDALHGFQLWRGVVGSGIVLALAWPMALLVDMPELWPGFAAMAVLPAIWSVAHLDPFRQMREGRYGANALAFIVPALASLLSIWPFALWLGDWRAFIGMQLVYVAMCVVTSHAVATCRYRPNPRSDLRENVHFLLPMLATGALVMLAMQGDRVIVARAFSENTLAAFAVALTLTIPLIQLALKAIWSFVQPKLAQADDAAFPAQSLTAFELHLIAAFALLAGFVLFGPLLIAILFNADLQPAAGLIGMVAAVQSLRLIRAGVTVSILARGDSVSDFLSNVPRIVALAVGAGVLALGGNLWTLMQIAALGECGGLLIALNRLPDGVARSRFLISALPLTPAVICALIWPPEAGITWIALALAPILAIGLNERARSVARGLRLPTWLNRHDPKAL